MVKRVWKLEVRYGTESAVDDRFSIRKTWLKEKGVLGVKRELAHDQDPWNEATIFGVAWGVAFNLCLHRI